MSKQKHKLKKGKPRTNGGYMTAKVTSQRPKAATLKNAVATSTPKPEMAMTYIDQFISYRLMQEVDSAFAKWREKKDGATDLVYGGARAGEGEIGRSGEQTDGDDAKEPGVGEDNSALLPA